MILYLIKDGEMERISFPVGEYVGFKNDVPIMEGTEKDYSESEYLESCEGAE